MTALKPLNCWEQLRVNATRLFGDLRAGLGSTSPLPTRAFIAIATLCAAVGLWFAGEEWGVLQSLESMRDTAPRWLWAFGFTFGAVGSLWRLIDQTPRFYVGLVINSIVAAMWTLVSIDVAFSGSLFVAAAPITIALQAAWITLRTGATHLDRSRA